jgi:hypothetical protein
MGTVHEAQVANTFMETQGIFAVISPVVGVASEGTIAHSLTKSQPKLSPKFV